MPAKLRQQIRLTPELLDKVRHLGELWAGAEGPLTPSAVFRVAVEREWEGHQKQNDYQTWLEKERDKRFGRVTSRPASRE